MDEKLQDELGQQSEPTLLYNMHHLSFTRVPNSMVLQKWLLK